MRLLILGLTLLFFSCTRNSPVVKVGDATLTEREVHYRNELIKVYFPGEKRELGENQLVRAYTYAQILKNHGKPITATTLKEEEARIDRETAAPEVLAKIKAIFGKDHDAYLSVFILPTFAERIIYYGFFLKDPAIHAESRAAAETYLDQALKKPSTFPSTNPFRISLERGTLPMHEPPANPNGVPPGIMEKMDKGMAQVGRKWVEEVIRPLKPGQIFPKVIDQQESWQVVRYVKPEKGKKDTYLMESVSFPKIDYGTWLKKETEKIPVVPLKH